MNMESEIHAWHFETRKPVRLSHAGGLITQLKVVPDPPPQAEWIAPGLFDLQINGYGGIDFQQDDLTIDSLLTAARSLRLAGCTKFLFTLITEDWPCLLTRLRHARSLREQSAELQAAIAGWHIEGPFLSGEPGFHGAHNPAWMRDPTPEHMLELHAVAGEDPLLVTVSPERSGALKAIQTAVSTGISISLGHTDASADLLREAVQAGARGFTHLGNGCPRSLDRHDNILWRVFETPGLLTSLIPDQIHVSPPLFRLVHRTLGFESIYYTTDAMSAAGCPPGRYKLGTLELDVGADQIVRQPGKPLFAGSALQPIEGVFRAAQMLGCPWQNVWPGWSTRPAKLLGLRNELDVGEPANFCLLKMNAQNKLQELRVCFNGHFA